MVFFSVPPQEQGGVRSARAGYWRGLSSARNIMNQSLNEIARTKQKNLFCRRETRRRTTITFIYGLYSTRARPSTGWENTMTLRGTFQSQSPTLKTTFWTDPVQMQSKTSSRSCSSSAGGWSQPVVPNQGRLFVLVMKSQPQFVSQKLKCEPTFNHVQQKKTVIYHNCASRKYVSNIFF